MPNFSLSDDTFRRAAEFLPTPFHLYDEAGIRRTLRALYGAFNWNKGFKEYFAIKALPNPAILRIVREEGGGVDCSSLTELMLAKAVGFEGEEIMFSANAMPPEEFTFARGLNAFINLDDITHIPLLQTHGGIPKCVCLRYNPGGDFKIGGAIMGNPGDSKYGFTRAQLSEGLRQLKAMGVERFGLHAFLASNMVDNGYYPTLARLLFQTGVELAKESGLALDFINLSGGVGIPYLPEQTKPDIAQIGRDVEKAYHEVFDPAGLTDVKLKTELGRYITGPNGWLLTHATHHKDTYKHYIGVDASAVNLIRPAMYGAYHHITVCGKRDMPCDHQYDVTGSLCENNDKFAVDRMLPEIDEGDLLVIHDTGAHGFSMGYNYNGRLRSGEVLLREDGSFQLIRRPETPADYFATLSVDPVCFRKLQEMY